jgi:hypothetical protein
METQDYRVITGNIMLTLCLTKLHAMKTYGRVEV